MPKTTNAETGASATSARLSPDRELARASRRLARMRWIDHWVGLPLCFMLGLASVAARKVLPRRRRQVSGQGTLAVYKFFGMGSVVEATPLLRAVKARYPRARLVFVTFQANSTLLERMGLCDEVRVIRTDGLVRFIRDVIGAVVRLRLRRVEATIDLEFFSKFSTLLAALSGAKVRIGYHLNDFWRRSLVTHAIYFNYFRHITDVFDEAARHLDVSISDNSLSRLEPPLQARQSVEESLRNAGWRAGRRLLGVNVNAGELSLERRWPIERFAAVIGAMLARNEDLCVVLIGSPAERAYTETVFEHLPVALRERVFNAAGRWSLDEFLAALTVFDGLLTNDSGPMHLAAAQGTSCVSIWGPGRPDFFAPRVPNHFVVYADYRCSPCLYMFTTVEGMWCNHQGWCMQAVPTQAVLEAVERMLRRTGET